MAINSPPRRRRDAIAPERLYPLAAFQEISGIGHTRMREGRLAGVFCPMLEVGRRKYVKGIDGIAYVEALAELTARLNAARNAS